MESLKKLVITITFLLEEDVLTWFDADSSLAIRQISILKYEEDDPTEDSSLSSQALLDFL